jgi:hypothetical protein
MEKEKVADVIFKKDYFNTARIKAYFANETASGGPEKFSNTKLGYQGCSDINLRLDRPDSPVHSLIKKLETDFGNFYIHTSTLRTLYYPFMPHTDIRGIDHLQQYRKQGYTEGWTFLLLTEIKPNYNASTVFYNNPPHMNESNIDECSQCVPYTSEYSQQAMNLSVKKVLHQKVGDLVAWKNFQWHSTGYDKNWNYNHSDWCKRFVSIETWSRL